MATERFEMLEIEIPAGQTAVRFKIPDQPQLRTDQDADIIIQAIEAYDSAGLPLSPANVAVVDPVNFAKTYLVLYIDGEESMFQIPLIRLKVFANEVDGGGANLPYVWNLFKTRNLEIDWTKSYFLTPTAYDGGENTQFSFLLGIHYMKLPPGTMQNIRAKELQMLMNP